MEPMTKKDKIKAGLATLAIAGSALAGIEAGRPDCDYVIIKADNTEICLTEEQATEMLKERTGFGGIRFGGTPVIAKK